MQNIQLVARLQIHPGEIDHFKSIAEECISIVHEKEPNTLEYSWFFNADESECIVRENYTDSNATLQHLGNVGPQLGQLFAISDFSGEVYGEASEELKKATEGLPITFYSFYKSK